MPFCSKQLLHNPLCLHTPCWVAGIRAYLLAIVVALAGMLGGSAHAQNSFGNVRFDLVEDGVRMSGNVHFTLSGEVRDVLDKGVPVYFVLETDTQQKRWYWSDKAIFSQRRYIRLMYVPLTRKWRVNSSNQPFGRSSTGVVLNQNHDSLEAALSSIQRISSWQVLQRTDWGAEADYWVRLHFQLDVSRLQRPLQLGTGGNSAWNLDISTRLHLTPQSLAN